MPRIVILTEGKSTPNDAKTATGLLRYRPQDVVAVLDSTCKGKRAGEVLGTGGDIPIIGKLDDTNVMVATGHYRNGILLGPLTGTLIAAGIMKSDWSGVPIEFSPQRFAR